MSANPHAARVELATLHGSIRSLADHYADQLGRDPSDPSLTTGVPKMVVDLVDELHAADPQDAQVTRLAEGLREHQLQDENDPRRALMPIAIPLSTLLELLDPVTCSVIAIYEDNGGGVHLARAGKAWDLGLVTPDMYGRARLHAQEVFAGVEPDAELAEDLATIDTGASHDAHRLIATWSPVAGLVVERDGHGRPCADAAGRLYLGLLDGDEADRNEERA